MAKARRRGPRSSARQRGGAPKRWTERDARRALEAWHASGLSLPAWCLREGVAYERVRRWRSQLGGRSQRPQSPALLPVEVLGSGRTAAGFELEFPRGLRLHVPPVFDEASLARLLRVVEASA